jgi:hypothetical protein
MTEMNSEVATTDGDSDRARKAAILRAVGLDRVAPEQRELAIAIANRYDLDLMLKHLVLIEGRPYITRDALLWIAHRSGVFDGMVVTTPEIRNYPGLGDCWYAEATVWRRDMTHPFTYGGRYPTSGQNKKYGPEMGIKAAESMSLRRAFNVSAPTVEEQYESSGVYADDAAPQVPTTLAQRVAERVSTLAGEPETEAGGQAAQPEDLFNPEPADAAVDVPFTVEVDNLPTSAAAINQALEDDLAQTVARAELDPSPPADPATGEVLETADDELEALVARAEPAVPTTTVAGKPVEPTPIASKRKVDKADPSRMVQCEATSPFGGAQCRLPLGHRGAHKSAPNESF